MLDSGLDQAAGLRRLLQPPPILLLPLALAPGQPAGWVAQLARGLHAIGRNPVVVDAARGTVATAFGLRPRGDLINLLQGRQTFDLVASRTRDGIHVLRGDRGVEAFAASGAPTHQLLKGFATLSQGFDDLLLAMPATELACLADPATAVPVVAVDAQRPGTVASYALLKQLAETYGYRRIACVLTGADDEAKARAAFERLAGAAARFLPAQALWAGWLPGTRTGTGGPHAAAGAALALALVRIAATSPA